MCIKFVPQTPYATAKDFFKNKVSKKTLIELILQEVTIQLIRNICDSQVRLKREGKDYSSSIDSESSKTDPTKLEPPLSSSELQDLYNHGVKSQISNLRKIDLAALCVQYIKDSEYATFEDAMEETVPQLRSCLAKHVTVHLLYFVQCTDVYFIAETTRTYYR